MTRARVLVFGATGMLGFALQRTFHDAGYNVAGVVRDPGQFVHPWSRNLRHVVLSDIMAVNELRALLESEQPAIVVNATGIKHLHDGHGHLEMFRINSVFPNLLSHQCQELGARLVHFSSDGVFSGLKGGYSEQSLPDATDFYGQTKYVGEPRGDGSLTVRCSMIGISPFKRDSLVDWVLSAKGEIRGFSNSFFSGLPVNELARVLAWHVFPRISRLSGVMHLHAPTVSKLELVRRIATAWHLEDVAVIPDASVSLDRSLVSIRAEAEIGYVSPQWDELIPRMKEFYQGFKVSGCN
jgi:dTDP-4-dehydrorhamnose reductase